MVVFKYRMLKRTVRAVGFGSDITTGNFKKEVVDILGNDDYMVIKDHQSQKEDITGSWTLKCILRNEELKGPNTETLGFLKRVIKEGGYINYIRKLEGL